MKVFGNTSDQQQTEMEHIEYTSWGWVDYKKLCDDNSSLIEKVMLNHQKNLSLREYSVPVPPEPYINTQGAFMKPVAAYGGKKKETNKKKSNKK